jgi:HD-GYP domain-containing protein (c-di-GMP phosphodiesterase class II)
MYDHKNGGRRSAGDQSKTVLVRALSERHPELTAHSADVSRLAELVARQLGLAEDQLESIRHAAELHDVGKVGIPDAILSKPGPLDADEWTFMRSHTIIGERIVAGAPALAHAARLVRSSHERWDGGGYPDGLQGDAIPIGARVIAVCDAFDAMRSERSYKPARSAEEALAELRRCAGAQFDPAVVEAYCQVSADELVAA